jgi:plastocyanin
MDRISSSRRARALTGLALLVALAGVACSKSSTPSATPGTSASPGTSTTGGAASTKSIVQGANGQLVFFPSSVSVKTGTTLTIQNVGSVPHTFTISGQGVDVTNDTGQTHQVTISLSPGTYPFICRFHESSGMTGTLTVTS